MKRVLPVLIVLLLAASCTFVGVPVADVPIAPVQPEPSLAVIAATNAITEDRSFDNVQEPILHINYAKVFNIDHYTAEIEFEANIPCKAIIRLIENETEIMQYTNNWEMVIHHTNLVNLKPAFYKAMINVSHNGQTDTKTVDFNTFDNWTPLPLPATNILSVDQGIITAEYYDGDGSIEDSVWTFEGYPGVDKYCRVRINNQTAKSLVIQSRISEAEVPFAGEGKYEVRGYVSVYGEVFEIPADGVQYMTFRAYASSDAPKGMYRFKLGLIYHFFGEFDLPISEVK